MGNHDVGYSMERAAADALRNRRADESALSILDRICEPFRGYDAEFESTDPNNPHNVNPEFDKSTDPHPKAALGMLMVEAFAPNGLGDLSRYQYMVSELRNSAEPYDQAKDEAACGAWWAEVYTPFNERYGFW